ARSPGLGEDRPRAVNAFRGDTCGGVPSWCTRIGGGKPRPGRSTPRARSSPRRVRLRLASPDHLGSRSVTATDRLVYLRRARGLIDLRYAEPLDLDAMAGEA